MIVTAELPAPMQAWADGLRKAHFPPERNQVRAHVTLLHALPPYVLDEAKALLSRIAAQNPPVEARLTGVMDLGSGTALRIESPAMMALRDEVADHFHGLLTLQDDHVPRLHITVQNKVLRKDAIALQMHLQEAFAARSFSFAGLALHHYLGGPWGDAGRWSFRGGSRGRRQGA
ncbi:2'-5' RNA ligase family protein [Novosphingobium sp. AAP83]|uniref:2'-5' RNA ligase family protein n=1 Tax=Novosphingobium sp. AAP83 TaxID=1523425 RepID=UPI00351041B7